MAKAILPVEVRRWVRAKQQRLTVWPPVGLVRFGNLRRIEPISRKFGFDRGQCIDRYYIENFLGQYAEDIRGHVLEIGDDMYTRQFGGERVVRSDVLHVQEGNPKATVVADLTCADSIPPNTFDCIIFTQTLQFIYDVRAAIGHLHRILKPGGVLLATFPGISQISRYDMDRWGDYWRFTTLSARKLFEEIFPPENVTVRAYGNVLAAVAFLHGLAAEELRREELDYHDPDYELIITVRAVKPREAAPMRVRGLGRLKRIWRWATAPLRSGAVILLYHRVFDASLDPQLLCVTPQNFAAHMEHLHRHYRVLSMEELQRLLLEGTLPRRAVLVTFDDGYADNLWNARPILERYGVPATVFVAAGYVGQEREFWWDEVERLLLRPDRVPRILRLVLDGRVYEWDLGDAAEYTTAEFERHRGWHVLMKGDPTPRHRACRDLCRLLRPLPDAERRQVLDELREWAGVDGKARSDYRPLTRGELLELTRDGLVEVGAHTVNHPILSALSVEEQRREISESKTTLEAALGRAVVHFAYPYGSRADYTPETVALVREAGFAGACSNFGGTVSPGRGLDLYQLPRLLVRNWTGEEFARRLARWFRE